MRTILILAVLLFALAPVAVAQGWSRTQISPNGAEFVEGSSGSDIMLGNWNPQTRTQQIDDNLVGQGFPVIRAIGWRRDGQANAGAAKVTELTILMSHADYASITNVFASNYKGQPQTVFSKKQVNLPDWNASSGSTPSPFDVVVPLDMPFLYNGQDALLYDVLNENNPLGKYQQDWFASMAHTYGAYPQEIGAGCSTGNGVFHHRTALRANTTAFEMGFVASGAPASAALTVLIGVTDPALNLPGLCAPLHVTPLLQLNAGTASASGDLLLAFPVSLPWDPSWAGATLLTQMVTADASRPIPVALSNAIACPLPTSNAAGTAPIQVKRIYHTSSISAATGSLATSAVPTFYAF